MFPLEWVLLYIGIASLAIASCELLRLYTALRWQRRQKYSFLTLTSPLKVNKGSLATEHLFNVIHALGSQRNFTNRLLGRVNNFSLEVVSTRHEGMVYLVRLQATKLALFQQQLAIYLPDIHFAIASDYLSELPLSSSEKILEFKQLQHFAFPLASYDAVTEHDLIAYVSSSMTQLCVEELMVFQIVASPIMSREAVRIRRNLVLGKEPNLHRGRTLIRYFLVLLLKLPISTLRLASNIVSILSWPTYRLSKRRKNQAAGSRNSAANVLRNDLHEKLSQPLFEVSIRVLVRSNDNVRWQQNMAEMKAALASYSTFGYQALIPKANLPGKKLASLRHYLFRNRLPFPVLKHNPVLSVAELTALYHFPNQSISDTGNIAFP